MVFFRIAFKNLLRHKLRSLLTLIGISASIAVLFSILSFNRGFERGLAKELERTGLHFMIVPSGCPHEVASLVLHGGVIPKFLDVTVFEKIKKFDQIELVTSILVTQLPNQEKGRVDLVYGMEMKHASKIKPGWIIKGYLPEKEDELLVGSEIAGHDKLTPGDNYRYGDRVFKVSGIIEKTGSQDDAFIYMPVLALQKLVGKEGRVTALGVRVKNPADLNHLTELLSKEIPGIQIVTMGQVMNSIASIANSAKILSLSVAMIAIIISSVGVMNSILMAIFERTQEIGMMRAIGAAKVDIFRMIIFETMILTTVGGLVGLSVSLIGSGVIEIFVKKFMPYVPSGRMITFEPFIAFTCIIFSIAIGMISGGYPAYRASRVSPIEAIKG